MSPHAQWKYVPTPKYRKIQCSSFSLPLPLSTSLSIPLHSLTVPERDLSFFDVSMLLFMLLFSIFPVVHLKKFYSSIQYLLSTYCAWCIVLSAWKMYKKAHSTPSQTAKNWKVQNWEISNSISTSH